MCHSITLKNLFYKNSLACVCSRAPARPPALHTQHEREKEMGSDGQTVWMDCLSSFVLHALYERDLQAPSARHHRTVRQKHNAKRCKHVVCGETSQHQVHEATGLVTPAHVTLCPTFGPGMPVETLTCRQNWVSLTSCLSESDDCAAGVESFCSSDGVRHECVC